MNEHEPHPARKPNLEALRAKVQAWRDARAARELTRPPVQPEPGHAALYALTTAWLDRLSYLDDWSDC